MTQPVTGVQRFGIEITKQLKKTTNLICLSPPNIIHHDLAEELEAKIIGRFSSHLWEQIELPFYLKRIGSPLLFNYNGLGPIFYRNKLITIHDVSFLRHPEWFSKSYSLFYRTFTGISASNSKKIITVSEFSANEIVQFLNIPKDKIEVIYNAVNHSAGTKLDNLIDGKYILTVSSLDPRKNLEKLIEAFKLLNREDIKLVIVGASNKIFNQSIKSIDDERIIFFGHANDEELSSLYMNAEVFVFPSLYEGFGIPPLEAMKHGCPVICSNKASLPEVCGKAAIMVDPNNPNEISNGIKFLLDHPEEKIKLIEKGYKNITRFSWERSAKSLISVINDLII